MKIKDEYNKKYVELSLTGNISQNPKYVYEYELPKDFDESIKVISALNNSSVEYEICLNKNNELVLNTDIIPAYLCYKPKQGTKDIPNNTFNEHSLFSFSDLERKVAIKIAVLREANIEPKNITFSCKLFNMLQPREHKLMTFQDLPVVFRIGQTEDFIIGV